MCRVPSAQLMAYRFLVTSSQHHCGVLPNVNKQFKKNAEVGAVAQGNKRKYTEEQKRRAERIEETCEQRGVTKAQAERREWATVTKQSGGGEKFEARGKRRRPVAADRKTLPIKARSSCAIFAAGCSRTP
jgi:plasmid stabilization system protein ParE